MRALLSTAEEATALPFPPVVFGVGVFVGLVALLLIAVAFRNLGSRH